METRRELLDLVRAARAHLEALADSGVEQLPGRLPSVAAKAMPRTRAPVESAPLLVPVAPAPAPSSGTTRPPPIEALAATPRVGASAPPRRVLSSEERRRQLQVLSDEVASCTRCPLHATRTRTVFARGNPDAELVFVGEGPAREDELQGEPFVGPAGELLDKMIGAMGCGRDDAYIMTVVKCRSFEPADPTKDRKPDAGEMAACRPFFDRQLELLDPSALVGLGATAVQALTGSTTPITRLRGTWRLFKGRVPLMPTFHPAYLLRSPDKKRDVWDDLKQVMQRLGKDSSPKDR